MIAALELLGVIVVFVLNFIYDLENECIKLAAICKEIRRKHGEEV